MPNNTKQYLPETLKTIQLMVKELEPFATSFCGVHTFDIGCVGGKSYQCDSREQALKMKSAYRKEMGITEENFHEWSEGIFDESPTKAQLANILSLHRRIYGNPESLYAEFKKKARRAVADYLLAQEGPLVGSFVSEFLNNWEDEPAEEDIL